MDLLQKVLLEVLKWLTVTVPAGILPLLCSGMFSMLDNGEVSIIKIVGSSDAFLVSGVIGITEVGAIYVSSLTLSNQSSVPWVRNILSGVLAIATLAALMCYAFLESSASIEHLADRAFISSRLFLIIVLFSALVKMTETLSKQDLTQDSSQSLIHQNSQE